MSINKLYQEAQAGDQTGENRLFQKLSARFRYFAQRKLGDVVDVEEVVQEALTTVFEKYKDIEFTSSFAAWAHNVLNNKILGYYRQKASRGGVMRQLSQDPPFNPVYQPDAELESRLLQCLKKINQVNNRYARSLALHYQGYSVNEICARMRVMPNTFYSILSRARVLLERCLETGDVTK